MAHPSTLARPALAASAYSVLVLCLLVSGQAVSARQLLNHTTCDGSSYDAAVKALRQVGLAISEAEWINPRIGAIKGRGSVVAHMVNFYWPVNGTQAERACIWSSMAVLAEYFTEVYSPDIAEANLTTRMLDINIKTQAVLEDLTIFYSQTGPVRAQMYNKTNAAMVSLVPEVFDTAFPAGALLLYQVAFGGVYLTWLQDTVYRYGSLHNNATDPNPSATYAFFQERINAAATVVNASREAIVSMVLPEMLYTNATCTHLPGSLLPIGNCPMASTASGFSFDFDIPFQSCPATLSASALQTCLTTSPCGTKCWDHGVQAGGTHLTLAQADATRHAYSRTLTDYISKWRVYKFACLVNPMIAWKALDEATNLAVRHDYQMAHFFVGGSGAHRNTTQHLAPPHQVAEAKFEWEVRGMTLWGGPHILNGVQLLWRNPAGEEVYSSVAGLATGTKTSLDMGHAVAEPDDDYALERIVYIKGQISWKYHNYFEVRTNMGRTLSAGSLVEGTQDASVYEYDFVTSAELFQLRGLTVYPLLNEAGATGAVMNMELVMNVRLWKTQDRSTI